MAEEGIDAVVSVSDGMMKYNCSSNESRRIHLKSKHLPGLNSVQHGV